MENSGIQKDALRKLSKAFYDIKKSVVGFNSKNEILDKRLEKALGNLDKNVVNKNPFNYAETIRSLMTQNIESKNFDANFGYNIFTSPDNKNRFMRYKNADEVVTIISYCDRSLTVLKDGILSPDDLTKDSIEIKLAKDNDEINREIVNDLTLLSNTLDLETYLDEIVKETLKYGDKFVEICDYKSDEVPLTQSLMLSENKKIKKIKPKQIQVSGYKQVFNENTNDFEKVKYNNTITLEIVCEESKEDNITFLEEAKRKNKKENKKDLKHITDIKLILHEPHRIVKLQSKKFKMNLGYLVMPVNKFFSNEDFSSFFGGNTQNNSGMSSSSGFQTGYSGFSSSTLEVNLGVDSIYKEIISNIKNYIKTDDLNINKSEIKDLIKKALKDLDEEGETVFKIRYVPPERMEHFMLRSSLNFPYGEGIFEKVMLDAKFLIALKTAISIRRVTDSSDKRIIYVDTGLPRNARNMIETLKEALKKRRFSIGSLNNINSIPTMITSYEDYIIPQNKGKRYVEFDTLAPTVNVRDATEELKFFRDELVAGLEIPAPYINLTESISNKSLLAHESAMFAETILSYQKVFSRHLFSLFSKLYKFTFNNVIPDEISITFPPPKMLFVEKEAENVDVVMRLIEAYKNIGVPEEWLKQKYVNLDWDEIEKYKTDELLKKRAMPGNPQAQGYDDMGYGGIDAGMGDMGLGGGVDPNLGMVPSNDPSAGGGF